MSSEFDGPPKAKAHAYITVETSTSDGRQSTVCNVRRNICWFAIVAMLNIFAGASGCGGRLDIGIGNACTLTAFAQQSGTELGEWMIAGVAADDPGKPACETGTCLVHHFQGRLGCPYGGDEACGRASWNDHIGSNCSVASGHPINRSTAVANVQMSPAARTTAQPIAHAPLHSSALSCILDSSRRCRLEATASKKTARTAPETNVRCATTPGAIVKGGKSRTRKYSWRV